MTSSITDHYSAGDLLDRLKAALLDDGVDAAAIEAVEAEQSARVDAAEETARNSGPPSLDIADTEVWSDGGSSWRN